MSNNPNGLQNPPTPQSTAQSMQLIARLADLDPKLRSQLAKMSVDGQRVILPVPYWSVGTWNATLAGGPPATVNIDTNRRGLFQYAQGQTMDVAGDPGVVAQTSDTNLNRQGETLNNSDVEIFGLCLEIMPGSEPLIVEHLWRNAFVDISMDGQKAIKLGTPCMFPSAGGLYGSTESGLLLPDQATAGRVVDVGQGAKISYLANGNPIAGSFIRFPEPFTWGGVGNGGADASLTVGITLTRAMAHLLPAARVAVPGGATTPGTGGWTPPTAGLFGTWAKLRCRLVARSVSRRSVNT